MGGHAVRSWYFGIIVGDVHNQFAVNFFPFFWRLQWATNDNSVGLCLGPLMISYVRPTEQLRAVVEKDLV
jgi:hypothetical protein